MTTYHQAILRSTPADALTDAARRTSENLRRLGDSEVFARVVEPSSPDSVRALHHLPLGTPDDVVVFHCRGADEDTVRELLERPEQLVLVHHGGGAPEPLTNDVQPADHQDADRPLMLLSKRVMVAIADSPTTAERLIRMGYNHVRVAHDFTNLHPPSMWANDVGTERELDDAVGVPFALVASELSREASPHVLLHALHVLQTVHDVELGLVLVGPSPDASYERALRRLVDGLRLRHVWFAGVRTGPSLTTLFRSARMCCSAGSSGVATRAPMLEAMALGVPTVVRDVAGVAPTRGALRLPPSSGPLMFVEALLLLHRDESTRASRVAAGLASVSEHHDPGRPRTIADLIAAAELAP